MKKTYSTGEEWREEGQRLFGKDILTWRFKCPRCGTIATGQDFKDAGANPNDMYEHCIGRFDPNRGCDWAAYGLFDICETHIGTTPVFDFAPYGEESDGANKSS